MSHGHSQGVCSVKVPTKDGAGRVDLRTVDCQILDDFVPSKHYRRVQGRRAQLERRRAGVLAFFPCDIPDSIQASSVPMSSLESVEVSFLCGPEDTRVAVASGMASLAESVKQRIQNVVKEPGCLSECGERGFSRLLAYLKPDVVRQRVDMGHVAVSGCI